MATLAQINSFVRPEVPGVDEILLENEVRHAVIDFYTDSWVKTSGIATTVASINTSFNDSIDIDVTSYGLQPVGIDSLFIDSTPWRVEFHEFDDHYTYFQEMLDQSGYAKKVFFFPDTTVVRLAPFESSESGKNLYVRIAWKPLYSFSVIDDVIFNDWVKTISARAKETLMAMPSKKWSNPSLSLYYGKKYREGCVDAKLKNRGLHEGTSASVIPQEFSF